MSYQTRECPRCGYENVPRAVYCFQCGRNLDEPPTVHGVQGTSKLIDDALKFIKERGHTLEPSMVERLRESKMKAVPENLNGEPLTCLHCGALNLPHAEICTNCKVPLIVADEDFNLIARASARTSVGQVRDNNEDRVNIWGLDGMVLALVADGMGGAAAGEVASRLSVESVQADFVGETRGSQELQTLSESDLNQRMIAAIQDANAAVLEKAKLDPTRKGMGTTSTLVMVRGNRAIVAHVGDSRAYHIDGRDGTVNQITDDHSFVQALVASGHITAEQAKHHPMGNVLYRALGQSMDLDVDTYVRYLKAGDRLVICSDGLTRHLQPTEISKIVMATNNPDEATLDLVEAANAKGGEDNVSVIVIHMLEAVSPPGDTSAFFIQDVESEAKKSENRKNDTGPTASAT